MDINGIATGIEQIKNDSDCECVAEYTATNELEKLRKFKEYFDELYGTGLEVKNWHLNGDIEPFDNFYESAICESGL